MAARCDDDWQEFNEFTAAADDTPCVSGAARPERENCTTGDQSSRRTEQSLLQNRVRDWERNLSACFTNNINDAENISDINAITGEHLLREDEIWNALTDNFGNVMPVDWKTSHTRSLHLTSLKLTHRAEEDIVNLDLSDDEELREQMDLHTIIVSCVIEEPLFTAEQVISEIEEMMQDTDTEQCVSLPDLSILSQELHTLTHTSSTSSCKERVRGLSVCELEALLDDVDRKIRVYSEELIDQLALRDELDFEKEVKNAFISLLIDVQNTQKDMMKRRRKGRTSGTPRGERTHTPGTYLTTVIPYEKKSGAPSVEDLQILTKILHAMRDDSDKVPSLLTDYILKVLCPT